MQDHLDDQHTDATNDFLAALYPYISKLAHQYIPRDIFSRDILDLEIDEITQVSLIKIWDAVNKHKNITNVKAYVRSIVHNEAINMLRRKHRQISTLPLDNDGELHQGNIIAAGQPPQEPGDEIEEEETLNQYTITIVDDIQAFPPRQQRAFMGALKDHIDDILPLVDALAAYGLDVKAVEKSPEKQEQQRLRASLNIARKKLQKEKYLFAR